jgi:hypothetical protein
MGFRSRVSRLITFALEKLGVPSSEFARLTATHNIFEASVTEELLDYLVEDGLLHV